MLVPKDRVWSMFRGLHWLFTHNLSGAQGVLLNRCAESSVVAGGIIEDSTVRVFNARGACLGGIAFSEQLHPDVVELPTGA